MTQESENPPPRTSTESRSRAERAIRDFLLALGIDTDQEGIRETPSRVAEAWARFILAGYDADLASTLGNTFATDSRSAVVVTRIPFFSMCPHHLLPLTGHAHLAMLPDGRVPGFGGVSKLIDALAHRLVLQEDLAQSIVDTLGTLLGPRAAVCILEAQHTCVAVTDPARQGARFRTTATAGDEQDVRRLLDEISQSLSEANDH